MKRIFLYSFLSLFILIATIVVKAPAAFLLGHAMQKTQLFYMDNISGSLWNGKAQNLQIKIPVGRRSQIMQFSQVSWDLSALSLLTGKLSAEIEAKGFNQSIDFDISVSLLSGEVSLGESWLEADLALIKKFYPIPAKIGGRAELNITEALVQTKTENGMPFAQSLQAQLVIKELMVKVQKEAQLGDFGVNIFTEESDVINASFTDVDAVVGVTGKASFNQQTKAYSAKADIESKSNTPKIVTQALGFVARRDAKGIYALNYSGKL